MAALNFPNSPSLNDTHTENGVTFKWNGAAWDRLGDIGAQGATGAQGAAGAQGTAGAAGAQGSTGPVAGSSSQVVYKDGSNNPAGSANFTFDGTNLTVSGNVSIGGTLTYEDVTNIDSVGIITARLGVKVPDSQKVFLGTSDDLQIYHDGSWNYIQSHNSKNFVIQVNDNENAFVAIPDGEVQLYHNNVKKFETTTYGSNVTGDLRITDNSARLQLYDANASSNTQCTGGLEVYDQNGNRGAWIGLTESASSIHFGIYGSDVARIASDGTLNLDYGAINLGAADSSSGHINAYELMTFNIDSDNDDTNRHFTWYKNGFNGGGTGMMRLDENGRLCVGGDLATSANNITLKNSSAVEIDMNCTSGSGNNFRIKSDSAGVFTIRDHSSSDDRITITDAGKIGINETAPDRTLHVNSGATDTALKLESTDTEVSIELADNTGSSYIGGGGNYLNFYSGNNERLRIISSGEVNIGGSDMTQSIYAFQVAKDLGTPSASGTNLVHFKNANATYSQNLYLGFNNSKDIIWTGGSGNGGMTWKMGTRGYNWEIGGVNKLGIGPSGATLNGTTDGVLNINTTDGRGSFIRFQENGTTKVWVGSGEGMGIGDQDDACLMSVDNIYFRNSTDSYTTLTVSKEGRLTGNKKYPDASGTMRSNPYYPPTNHYQTYSAPSGGNKWLRFGYFSSRGRYRITFNTTGGYYSPGSVTFDFNLYWASPHVYIGNVSKISSQYVSQFRVTSDSNGGNYYGEIYVSINGNQTGSHIHCTAQVLGTADREFNLHNYGYDLSTLTHTSGNFSL